MRKSFLNTLLFVLLFEVTSSVSCLSAIRFSPAGFTMVPAAVKAAFALKFPAATNVHWGQEKPGEWEADFRLNAEKLSANFLADGTWVETEKEIAPEALPTAVNAAIKKLYPGWRIMEADRTETAKNGLLYEANLKKGSLTKEVAFHEDGTVAKE